MKCCEHWQGLGTANQGWLSGQAGNERTVVIGIPGRGNREGKGSRLASVARIGKIVCRTRGMLLRFAQTAVRSPEIILPYSVSGRTSSLQWKGRGEAFVGTHGHTRQKAQQAGLFANGKPASHEQGCQDSPGHGISMSTTLRPPPGSCHTRSCDSGPPPPR